MFCPVCGQQREGNAAFCRKCGSALNAAPIAPTKGGQFKSIRTVGMVLAIAFCYVILFDLIAATIGILRVGSHMASSNNLPYYHDALMVISVLQSIVFIVTAIVFLVWVHRAYRNLEPLGSRNLKYSAGWAVGWFFIPLANLVMPFLVMKEIWKGSDPACTDGESWRNARVSGLVTAWWVLYIVSRLLVNLTLRTITGEDPAIGPGLLQAAEWAWLISLVVEITAAMLAIFVVWGITTRQDAKNRDNKTAPSSVEMMKMKSPA